MGSKRFQAYVANLQRLALAEIIDQELLASRRSQLSIADKRIRVIRTADDYRDGFPQDIWTR